MSENGRFSLFAFYVIVVILALGLELYLTDTDVTFACDPGYCHNIRLNDAQLCRVRTALAVHRHNPLIGPLDKSTTAAGLRFVYRNKSVFQLFGDDPLVVVHTTGTGSHPIGTITYSYKTRRWDVEMRISKSNIPDARGNVTDWQALVTAMPLWLDAEQRHHDDTLCTRFCGLLFCYKPISMYF